jgi:hypothetical protein
MEKQPHFLQVANFLILKCIYQKVFGLDLTRWTMDIHIYLGLNKKPQIVLIFHTNFLCTEYLSEPLQDLQLYVCY